MIYLKGNQLYMILFFEAFLILVLFILLLQFLFFVQYYFVLKQKYIVFYAIFLGIDFLFHIISNCDILHISFLHKFDWLIDFLFFLSPLAYYYFFKLFLKLPNTNLRLNKIISFLIYITYFFLFLVFIDKFANLHLSFLFKLEPVLLLPAYIYILSNLSYNENAQIRYLRIGCIFVVVGTSLADIFTILPFFTNLTFNIHSIFTCILLGLLGDVIFSSKAILSKH